MGIMANASTKTLWRERLLMFEVMQYWRDRLPLVVSRLLGSEGHTGEQAIADLNELVAQLSPDVQAWYRDHLEASLESCARSDEGFEDFLKEHGDKLGDTKELWTAWKSRQLPTAYDEFPLLLGKRLEEIERTLAGLAPGPEKAKEALRAYVEWSVRESDQIYDAMVLLAEELPQMTVAEEVADWKESLRSYEKMVEGHPFGDSAIFWRSRNHNDIVDAVSRYRFMDRFQVGEFPETMRDIEYMVGSELLNGLSGTEAIMATVNGDQHLLQSSVALFLASRSTALCARIRHFVEIALVRLAHQQFAPGYYTDYVHTMQLAERNVLAPSVYLTALAAVCLLRLARQQDQRDCGHKAVKWLARKQRVKGYWVTVEDGQEREPDLITTVLALEAIKLSGDRGMEHSLALGEQWLLGAQLPTGEWEGKHRWPPFPFATVLVLEYFEGARAVPGPLPNYLYLANGFLQRSAEFALEDDLNAWRLSLVVAYQGLEAFLYGLLTQQIINVDIFRNQRETIGCRSALSKLEEHLRGGGVLVVEEQLPYRSSLARLAHLRDEVVHKAAGVTGQECQELLADLRAFVDRLSTLVLGFSLR